MQRYAILTTSLSTTRPLGSRYLGRIPHSDAQAEFFAMCEAQRRKARRVHLELVTLQSVGEQTIAG